MGQAASQADFCQVWRVWNWPSIVGTVCSSSGTTRLSQSASVAFSSGVLLLVWFPSVLELKGIGKGLEIIQQAIMLKAAVRIELVCQLFKICSWVAPSGSLEIEESWLWLSPPSGEAAGGKEPCHSSKPADNAVSSIRGEFKRQKGVAVTKKRSQVLANCVKVTERSDTWWENMQR